MRDRERSFEKERPLRISFLGDSFTEAYHVPTDWAFNRLIEESCEQVEALNFGRGGYGTAQELLLYRQLARRFNSDIIAVLMNGGSDFGESSLDANLFGQKKYGMPENWVRMRPYFVMKESGELQYLAPILPPERPTLLVKMYRNFATYRVATVIWNRIKASLTFSTSGDESTTNQYKTDKAHVRSKEDIERDWLLSERILATLAKEVHKDGSKLWLIVIPSQTIDPDEPVDSLSKVEIRLQNIAKRIGAHFIALKPSFHRYLQQVNLTPPNFHFKYDGHWRPLGHWVMAKEILEQLHKLGNITERCHMKGVTPP